MVGSLQWWEKRRPLDLAPGDRTVERNAEIGGCKPRELVPLDLEHGDRMVERSMEIEGWRPVRTRSIFHFHLAVDT